MEDSSFKENDLRLNDAAIQYLHEIVKWSRFLSVAGYIGLGFLLLLGLVSGVFLTSSADIFTGIFVILFYSLFVGVYIFPVYYLFRFSVKMKLALSASSPEELEVSLSSLKSHFKFLSIASIIIISVYALFMVIAALGGLYNYFLN